MKAAVFEEGEFPCLFNPLLSEYVLNVGISLGTAFTRAYASLLAASIAGSFSFDSACTNDGERSYC